jgi:hypothetical protein
VSTLIFLVADPFSHHHCLQKTSLPYKNMGISFIPTSFAHPSSSSDCDATSDSPDDEETGRFHALLLLLLLTLGLLLRVPVNEDSTLIVSFSYSVNFRQSYLEHSSSVPPSVGVSSLFSQFLLIWRGSYELDRTSSRKSSTICDLF